MLLLLALLAAPVSAAPEPACRYTSLFAGRFNPLGLSEELGVRCEHRLYEAESPVLRTNFVALVPGLALSPASARPSISLEVQPLSILGFFASYRPTYWYGILGALQSFPSPRADWGSSLLGRPESPTGAAAQLVHEVMLGGLFQLRVGPFAGRSVARVRWFHVATKGGDPVFYDPTNDQLTPARGWTVESDTVATWSPAERVLLGVDLVLARAVYPDDAYAAGEPHDNRSAQARVGPLAVYTLWDHAPGARFDAPSLFVLTSFYLQHPYRAGDRSSAAIPYLAAGLSFSGDL